MSRALAPVLIALLACGGLATTAQAAKKRYYVSLGDSLAAGYQLDAACQAVFRPGYAGPVLRAVRKKHEQAKLVNYGCPGESTTTFQQGGCPFTTKASAPSQLARATKFIKKHRKRIDAITISIGANNFTSCTAGGIDLSCVAAGIGKLQTDEPVIFKAIRSAAGRKVRIANGYDAFGAGNITEMTMLNGESVPVAVANTCLYTQQCLPAPQGNIHPTDGGYALLGKAFVTALKLKKK